MLVLVGSRNPVKVAAVGDVFEQYFPGVEVQGIAVDSGVAPQPMGDETFVGAQNRALALTDLSATAGLGASYCVGLEGGISQLNGRWFAFGVICIADPAGCIGFGVSPMFELPPAIIEPLLAGEELGHVIDRLSGDQNTKQKGGAIGYLTQGRVGRRELYGQGIVMALVPFLNAGMYFGTTNCGMVSTTTNTS